MDCWRMRRLSCGSVSAANFFSPRHFCCAAANNGVYCRHEQLQAVSSTTRAHANLCASMALPNLVGSFLFSGLLVCSASQGDFTRSNGTGGESIYGEKVRRHDELMHRATRVRSMRSLPPLGPCSAC